MATPTLKAARSNRVGHATKDLLRHRAGQIFYCTLCVQNLNAVHLHSPQGCVAGVFSSDYAIRKDAVSCRARHVAADVTSFAATFFFWEKLHKAARTCEKRTNRIRPLVIPVLILLLFFYALCRRHLTARRYCLQRTGRSCTVPATRHKESFARLLPVSRLL